MTTSFSLGFVSAADRVRMAVDYLIARAPEMWGLVYGTRGIVLSTKVPRAAATDDVIVVNPEWCSRLSTATLAKVITHEALHVLRRDGWRSGLYRRKGVLFGRPFDRRLWVAAVEKVVNHIVDTAFADVGGFRSSELPDGKGLVEVENPIEAHLAAEMGDLGLYRHLLDTRREASSVFVAGSDGSDTGDGGDETRVPFDPESTEGYEPASGPPRPITDIGEPVLDTGKAEADPIETAVSRGTAVASAGRFRGTGSSSARRAAGMMSAAPRPWRELLAAEVLRACVGDYDQTRVDPKRLRIYGTLDWPLGLDHVPRIAIVIDTSGSISASELGAFKSAIADIARDLPNAPEVRILAADESVKVEKVVDDIGRLSETVPDMLVGGGGTDFTPAIRRLASLPEDERPDVVVYLTDLCGTFPPSPPPFKVVWASVSPGQTAPFGVVVPILEA